MYVINVYTFYSSVYYDTYKSIYRSKIHRSDFCIHAYTLMQKVAYTVL